MLIKMLFGLMSLLNFFLIIFFYYLLTKWIKKIQLLDKKTYHLQKLVRSLQVADMRFNRKVSLLQNETDTILSTNELNETATSKEDKYHYALKLLQSGMPLEEVIEDCDLIRAEAELLQSLEGYKKIKKSTI